MDNPLPVYRYPALTVLIDDSRNLLDSLVFFLSDKLVCKTFVNPCEALDWLRQPEQNAAYNSAEPIHVGYDEESACVERRNASIDVARIYRMVTNPQRFDVPAVVVVDYSMSRMNGLEFCAAIQHLPCKKMLLTGYLDNKTVIDAFNRKLIDCFINKGEHNASERLESEIFRLQNEFFIERSSTLKDLLSRHSYAFLSDPAIAEIVARFRNSHNFVEHYLFPDPPGILFFDMSGKATLMVIATEENLITQFEVAQDQEAPPELLAALQEFRLLPFFSDTHGIYLNEIGDNWRQYCQPPQICHGRHTYRWALFDLPPHYLQGPVYSYKEFLLNRDLAGGETLQK